MFVAFTEALPQKVCLTSLVCLFGAHICPAEQKDLVVIGGGPGGYVAAIKAAQLGMKVDIIVQEFILHNSYATSGCLR